MAESFIRPWLILSAAAGRGRPKPRSVPTREVWGVGGAGPGKVAEPDTELTPRQRALDALTDSQLRWLLKQAEQAGHTVMQAKLTAALAPSPAPVRSPEGGPGDE